MLRTKNRFANILWSPLQEKKIHKHFYKSVIKDQKKYRNDKPLVSFFLPSSTNNDHYAPLLESKTFLLYWLNRCVGPSCEEWSMQSWIEIRLSTLHWFWMRHVLACVPIFSLRVQKSKIGSKTVHLWHGIWREWISVCVSFLYKTKIHRRKCSDQQKPSGSIWNALWISWWKYENII